MWQPDYNEITKLRGALDFTDQYVFARIMSNRLRNLLENGQVSSLGCMDGLQAVQCVKAGKKSIYLSGWQTASNNNDSDQMYPDMGLYGSNSVYRVIRKINNALQRTAQISELTHKHYPNIACPIVADLENGFGGKAKVFELVKSAIEAGVAGIHLEDQSVEFERKCGHLAGKIIIPPLNFISKLKAARIAAIFCEVKTVIVARTDTMTGKYVTSNLDELDKPFLTGEITDDYLYGITGGIDMAVVRCMAYADYADLLWVETPTPSLEDAEYIAKKIHQVYPGKWLAYNCSPSFNYSKFMHEYELMKFQKTLESFGYRYVFITLAGFHSSASSMFDLARQTELEDMNGYSELQFDERVLEKFGYTALKHQAEVGTEWFDKLSKVIDSNTSISAMSESTEKQQF